MNSFGDTTNTYAAHAVHKVQGALIGDRTKTPLLTYPEPPIKFRLLERPRQDDANAGLNKIRAEAHVYYEKHTRARNSYKRWARAIKKRTISSFDFVGEDFEAALASIEPE